MGNGLDISSHLSLLAGLSRGRGGWRMRTAIALPGFHADPEQKPDSHMGAPLGVTWGALRGKAFKARHPAVLVPGREVYYRFAPLASTNPRHIEMSVRLEADEIAGEEDSILAGYVTGCDLDYAPALQIALAREEVIDHYANSLRASGLETGALITGCSALYMAYLISGDTEAEQVTLHANIGDDSTDVILVREGKLLYARSLSIGVNDFVTRLVPEYGGDRDAVRQELFNRLDLRPSIAADNLSSDRGVEGGQEVAARLFQQILGTVTVAKAAMKAPMLEARKIVLSGPGAAISGMRELMMNRVRKTVEIFNPFKNIDLEGLDDAGRETANAYRPAFALAIGLAALDEDRKAERVEFLPVGVRRRREFLSKSLFLYMAAALLIAVVLPLYVLTANTEAEAESYLRNAQQGPLGRYAAASAEIEGLDNARQRAERRAQATLTAAGPGRVATQVLLEFSRQRAQRTPTVRMRSVELLTDTTNPTRDPDFKPVTRLRIDFFIELQPGADPNLVNTELRRLLLSLPGVRQAMASQPVDNPVARGLDVVYTVELDILAQELAP
jgi:Tfp pilus assembly PilM family ATPase